jgi:hypothetical protein
MSRTSTFTGNELADALHTLGVNFIFGGSRKDENLPRKPASLIAALSESGEARLRLSLIPLFLEHPEFATYVQGVAKNLKPSARLTLQCYYTAAVWLEQKYQVRKPSLPDHFSTELNLVPSRDPDENLRALAKRHADLSQAQINWLGTYQHAAQVWIRAWELEHGSL